MENTSTAIDQTLDVIIQILIIVIPIVISWYIRTYVRGSVAEKDIAAIVRLSNVAIDYVENLDNRGDLNLPPEVGKGAFKLKKAGNWLENELRRANINITSEEAEKWISSEFQKRVGNVQMVGNLSQLAKNAVNLVRNLDQNDLIDLPPDGERLNYLTVLGADWVIAQAAAAGISVSQDEALTWVRAGILDSLQIESNNLPPNEQLAQLAKQAVSFLSELKAQGQLSIQSETGRGNLEMDVAMAWLLAEAAKRGLPATTEQITTSLLSAMST
ncbi:MAG: hypothetical protein DHS20C20_23060 [Ardenticatenaceae bacterium]|nr:MAG: hypothetical protein DHS20C20_23060 [Ardenticatenaceae bacterium]